MDLFDHLTGLFNTVRVCYWYFLAEILRMQVSPMLALRGAHGYGIGWWVTGENIKSDTCFQIVKRRGLVKEDGGHWVMS
jgi:hypothetical protein